MILHERARQYANVLHLHGELRKVRSVRHPELVYIHEGDLHLGDTCERGAQLRPHIVWFGESVPMLEPAAALAAEADAFLIRWNVAAGLPRSQPDDLCTPGNTVFLC